MGSRGGTAPTPTASGTSSLSKEDLAVELVHRTLWIQACRCRPRKFLHYYMAWNYPDAQAAVEKTGARTGSLGGWPSNTRHVLHRNANPPKNLGATQVLLAACSLEAALDRLCTHGTVRIPLPASGVCICRGEGAYNFPVCPVCM